MGHTQSSDQFDAQQRRIAVHMYRTGKSVKEIARKLKRGLSWVYKWIAHQAQHPWTRFRSSSRAAYSHPNQTSPVIERRVIRLRQQLVRHKPSHLRFAGIGSRTILILTDSVVTVGNRPWKPKPGGCVASSCDRRSRSAYSRVIGTDRPPWPEDNTARSCRARLPPGHCAPSS